MFYYIIAVISLLSALVTVKFMVRLKLIEIPDSSRRIGYLDGLRGYLAFFVLLAHFSIWTHFIHGVAWNAEALSHYSNKIIGVAGESVAIFFMITGLLFYKKIKQKNTLNGILAFYISRVFRLAPVMWFMIAAMACIAAFDRPQFLQITLSDIIGIIKWMTFFSMPDIFGHKNTYTIPAGVTWTLQYEWIYYVSIPFLSMAFFFTKKYISNKIAIIFIIGSVFVLFFYYVEKYSTYAYGNARFLAHYFALFPIGMLSFELSQSEKIKKFLCTKYAALIGLLFLVLEVATRNHLPIAIRYILLFLFFTPIASGNSYFGLLRTKFSLAFGTITYCVYLLQGIVLYLVLINYNKYFGDYKIWYLLPFISVVLVIFSSLIHRYIENTGIVLGRKLVKYVTGTLFPRPKLYHTTKIDKAGN